MNTNAAARFLHIYDKASAPTLNSDTPMVAIPLAASSGKPGHPLGMPGIALRRHCLGLHDDTTRRSRSRRRPQASCSPTSSMRRDAMTTVTYSGLGTSADLPGTDLIATWRSTGPLKTVTGRLRRRILGRITIATGRLDDDRGALLAYVGSEGSPGVLFASDSDTGCTHQWRTRGLRSAGEGRGLRVWGLRPLSARSPRRRSLVR